MRKHNLLNRLLALLLCLSMVLGFVPGGILGSITKASAVEAEDTSAKLYLNSEELTALKSYITDDSKGAYGFSWKSVYEDLIYAADTYLNETVISVSMNTGKSYTFPAGADLPDPNDASLREGYIKASTKESSGMYDTPYTGFGSLLFGALKTRMETLSLAYLLTRDTKYSDRAITYAMRMTEFVFWNDYYWLSKGEVDLWTMKAETIDYNALPKADAGNAWATQAIVAVYDMCADVLTVEQKHAIEANIITKGLLPISKNVKSGDTQNANMMYVGAMLSGLAAITGNVEDDLTVYETKADELVADVFELYATSGNTEGHYYTGYGLDYFLPGLAQLYRAGSAEAAALVDHTFLTDILPEWTVMFAAPNTLTHPNYSDGGIGVQLQLPMAVVSKLSGDPLANYFLLGAAKDGLTAFEKLVYLDVDPDVEAPEEYVSVVEELGYGALRTGFAFGDMLLTLKANDSDMGHNHYDQNAILFNVGGSWLIQDPGHGSYYYEEEDKVFYKQTGHSTILVDGQAQSVLGKGSTAQKLGSGLYSHIVGSAAGAYGEGVLTKFDRHAIQINHSDKAYYVVIDDLASAQNRTYGWQMYNGNCEYPEAFVGNNVTLPMGSKTLNLSFAGAALNIAAKNHELKDENGVLFTEKTLVANTTAASKDYQFMAVISEGEAVAVTTAVDNNDALAALINYSGNKNDFVMFNRTDAEVTADLLTTDAKQASLLGLVNGEITEGFAATGATKLTYDEKALLAAAEALDVVADSEGWHFNTANAQTVTLYVGPFAGGIRYNGTKLVPSDDGFITVGLAAGESTVEVSGVAAEEEIPVIDSFVDFDNSDWIVNSNSATVNDGVIDVAVENAGVTLSKAFKAYKRDLIEVSFDFALDSGEGAYAALYFYKDEVSKSTFVSSKKVDLTEDGEDLTISAQVPDGANIVELRIGADVGSTVAYTVSNVAVTVTPKILFNESFEDGKYGWNIADKIVEEGVETVTIVDGENGGKALQVSSPDKLARSVSQAIDATPYEVWTMTIRYKIGALDEEGESSVQTGIWFYKDKASNAFFPGTKEYMYYKGAVTVSLKDTAGEWKTEVISAMVPADANIVQVEFNNSSSQQIEYAVDYVTLERSNDEAYLFSEDFENALLVKDTWTTSNNWVSTPVGLYGTGNGYASQHMFLQAGGAWAKSPLIDVDGGMTYVAKFQSMKAGDNTNYSGAVQFVFVDADGNETVEPAQKLTDLTYKVMTEQVVSAIAPADAVKAYVKFTLGSASGAYAVDDLKITATETNWVFNGDFEAGTTNWSGFNGETSSVVEIDDDNAAQISSTGSGIAIKQNLTIDMVPGNIYEMTFNYKFVEGRTPYVGVWFFKDQAVNANWVATDRVYLSDQSGEWVSETLTVTVPEDANIAQIQIGYDSKSGEAAKFCIDDLVMTEVASTVEEETRDCIFEEQFAAEATLKDKGWTAYNDFASTPVDVYTAYNSTPSLYFQSKASAYAQSPKFAVEAGKTYTAELVTLRWGDAEYGGEAKFIFMDRDGNVLKTSTATRVATGATQTNSTEKDPTLWNAESFSADAPKNAVSACIYFSRTNKDFAIDDLRVYDSGETPAYELPNGDFENGFEGWKLNSGAHATFFNGAAWIEAQASVDNMSQEFAVASYDVWELKLDYKWISGDSVPYAGLWFYKDKNGGYGYDSELGQFIYFRGSKSVSLDDKSGEWVTITARYVVPADANLAVVEIGNASGATVSYEIDNVSVTKVADAVFADSFEYDVLKSNTAVDTSKSGVAIGWTATNDFANSDLKRFTPNNSWPNVLWFQSYKENAHTPEFPVNSGNIYVLDLLTYKSGNAAVAGYAKYVFLNKEGNQIGETTLDVGTGANGVYNSESLVAVAPEGAYTAYIEFGATNNYFGIDDLVVTEHPDANKDHVCDDCDVVLTECYDADDHKCDICGAVVSECADSDYNFACDICGEMLAEGTPINGNFDYTNAGLPGWIATSSKNRVILAVGEGIDGTNALMLQDTGTTDSPEIESERFQLTAGITYTLTMYVKKVAETEGEKPIPIGFYIFNEENLPTNKYSDFISVTSAPATDTEKWVKHTATFTVPEGTVELALRFSYDKAAINTVLIDDVSVAHVCADDNHDHVCDNGCDEYTGEHIDTDGDRICDYGCRKYVGAIFEDYFNTAYTPEGAAATVKIPVGWTTSSMKSANFGVASYEMYDGTTDLFIQAKGWMRSPRFDVTEGKTYTAFYIEKIYMETTGTGGYAVIKFVDAEDAVIGSSEQIVAGASTTWTEMTLTATAPAGAVEAYIEFGSTGDVVYGVENLGIFETEASEPEHECADGNKDHICDNGCDEFQGTCEDTDFDHACDYGCDKYFGECTDSAEDADHVCDYGCGKVLEECTDASGDGDHKCDTCGEDGITECTPADPVTENNVDPDCTTAGSYDSVVYCTECNKEFSRKTTTVPALGHKDENKDGVCDTCATETVTKFDLVGSNMTLGNNLAMNFFFKKSDVSEGSYVIITKEYFNDQETATKRIDFVDFDTQGNNYKVTFDGIAAKEMADPIKIEIFNADGILVSREYTDSVKTYVERGFAKNAFNEAMQKVAVDMLNYGAAAQDYFSDYNIENLANSGLTPEQKALATTTVEYSNNQVKGAKCAGANLSLKSNILLNIYYKNIDRNYNAKLIFTDYRGNERVVDVSGEEFTTSGTMLGVVVDDLVVSDGYVLVTCEMYDAEGNLYDTTKDSVESCVARLMATEDNADPVFDALMRFVYSTREYNLSKG